MLGFVQTAQVIVRLLRASRLVRLNRFTQKLGLQRFHRRDLPRWSHCGSDQNRERHKQRLRQPE